jgi:bifunctional non-homologous end joining protein LigD
MPPTARVGSARAPARKTPTRKSADRKSGVAAAAGAEPLREYEAKRAFDVTSEPAPAASPERSGPLLFVVQQHAARRMHWDFRLELDGVLKSWAVPKAPSLDPADRRLAVQVEDHPFEYASFEGVIPAKQYGAGEVIVWDCGVYSPDDDREYWFHDRDEAQRRLRAGLQKGKLSIFLRGEKLKGSFTLVRTKDTKNWFLIKHRDRFVDTAEVTQRDASIVSGMSVQDLERLPPHERIDALRLAPAGPREALPAKLSPMLAELGEGPFSDPAWVFEPKLDGYRALAFIDGGRVELRSRRGLDLTRAFPSIVAELRAQAVETMVLDGEVVALDPSGRLSFNALQNRVQLKTEREIEKADQRVPALFYAFDLLHFAGIDLRGAPYEARHRYLAQCLLPDTHVKLVDAHEDGEALYKAALAHGFEGVMAKRRSSVYEAGRRSPAWLKVKSTLSAEFVIGGYSKGKGSRAALGALLVGYWERDALRYAAHVGTGFNEGTLQDVKARCDALKSARMPFAQKPPRHGETVWIEPELVAEVKFAEWTPDGHLRAPVFLRLRDDADARKVQRPSDHRLEARSIDDPAEDALDDVLRQLDGKRSGMELAIGRHRLRVTNLDRVYWPADAALDQPALTKRDLLRYLTRVSPYMLTHLADRPLTMIRWPEGIYGERFFQKHWEQAQPDFVDTVEVYSESKGHKDEYLVVNNLATLLWVAQFGTLEYHVWHSRSRPGPDAATDSTDFSSSLEAMEASILNYPDYLVFDIDPYIYAGHEKRGEEPEPNETAFEKGKEVAFNLRELLNGMRLDPIVKTTGKTGLHVFVPIERTVSFDTVRQMSEAVGRHLMRRYPEDITMEWSVNKRTGKIFMDYNMNVRGKTLNAAYSPRGRPGAAVSVPVTWEELEKVKPMDFRMTNVLELIEARGDVWRDALRRKQSLDQALGAQGG